MNETPHGWHRTTLATVAQLKTGPFGSALHKSDYVGDGTPLINPSHIKHGKLQPDSAVSIDVRALERLSEYRLQAGDVVMGRRGEMGRCAVVPSPAAGWVCGTGSVIVRPTPAILPNFLQRLLSSPGAVQRLNGESVGSTMVNLNQGVLLGLPVALPPLLEQQRIADKLDAVVARVDACRDRLARVAPLLKRFRKSVLFAATSGVLTSDWRVQHCSGQESETAAAELPSGWRSTMFAEVCREITVGFVGRMATEYVDSGVPFLRSMNVREFRFDPKGLKFISPAFHRSIQKSALRPGDLAIVRSGAPGICCVVPPELADANCSDLVIARPGADLLSGYGCVLINSAFGASHVAATQVGVAQAHFNVGAMKLMPCPLPPMAEQAEIVRRVEVLFAFADRLEARLAKAQAAADRLTPALLAKAFRGELVSQDPADEPAAELLKRLTAGRPAPAAKVRRPRAA